MPEIHCQECNAWAAHAKHLEELLTTQREISKERIAEMLAKDAAATGHEFTDAADMFKRVVEQQKKEIEGLRNTRDNLSETVERLQRRLSELETRFAIYGAPATTREPPQQAVGLLQGTINQWKFILNESPSDNMIYHRPTIAAMLKDFQAVADKIQETKQ